MDSWVYRRNKPSWYQNAWMSTRTYIEQKPQSWLCSIFSYLVIMYWNDLLVEHAYTTLWYKDETNSLWEKFKIQNSSGKFMTISLSNKEDILMTIFIKTRIVNTENYNLPCRLEEVVTPPPKKNSMKSCSHQRFAGQCTYSQSLAR